jgi:hypothetical protein
VLVSSSVGRNGSLSPRPRSGLDMMVRPFDQQRKLRAADQRAHPARVASEH